MAQMTIAAGAGDLRPDHAMGHILFGGNRFWRDAVPKTWPTCARLKFCG